MKKTKKIKLSFFVICSLVSGAFFSECLNNQVLQSLISPYNKESDKKSVNFVRKVDGDTAVFEKNGEEFKCRFLAIDTPETVKSGTAVQDYGIEASNYTESMLHNANEISLEFDANSSEKDKYNRYLAWVWVDDILLQEALIEKGFAMVQYIYGDYKYLDRLYNAERNAKEKEIGIWIPREKE